MNINKLAESLLESSSSDYAIIRVPKKVLSNEFRTRPYDPPTRGEHPVIGDWVSADLLPGPSVIAQQSRLVSKFGSVVNPRPTGWVYSGPGDFSDVDLKKVDKNLIILFEYGGWLAVPHVKAQTVKQWVKQLQGDRRQSAEKAAGGIGPKAEELWANGPFMTKEVASLDTTMQRKAAEAELLRLGFKNRTLPLFKPVTIWYK
jgi:hypothetical protein